MSLSLGNLTFTVDELPERIELGGNQALAVRKFPGGYVDLQTLGAFDEAISWDGVLLFQTAISRARSLNTLRLHGELVTLRIGSLSQNVVVSRFRFSYENDFRLPYHIELQPSGLLNQLQSAVTQAQQATGAAAGTAAVTGQTTTGTTTLAQTAATPAAIAASVPVAQITPATAFGAAANTPVGTIVNRLSPAGTSPILSTVKQVMHYVQMGESLWHVASRHYGNGNLWTQIAAANNILNPNGLLPGQKIIIPNPTRTVR